MMRIEPQCKHGQSLEAEDVWTMKVVAGGKALVGAAGEGFDVERPRETGKSIAIVALHYSSTIIHSDISEDGEQHFHDSLLKDHIPKTLPIQTDWYDLALRIL